MHKNNHKTAMKSFFIFGFVVYALVAVIPVAQCSSQAKSIETSSASRGGPEPDQKAAPVPALEPVKPIEPAKDTPSAASTDPASVSAKLETSAAAAAPAPESNSGAKLTEDEQSKRKGRSDATSGESGKTSAADQTKSSSDKSAEPAKADKAKSEQAEPKSTAKPKTTSSSSSKASTKSKLPANLGTVTSTGNGNGGSAHYMSKHDAYSAIAEKHGAIAHDAMRKSDRHRTSSSSSSIHRFGGIQKASGIGDALNPFKSVTDSGLARTLGASMRSIMKSKYSVPAYVASALLGAVALMAFYESPISPLPVPPLPEPPVGRFPPEMPNIPAGAQIPFRGNQQGNYNQRMMPSNMNMNMNMNGQASQPQAQVLFPSGAQQRSGQVNSMQTGAAAQLATNLLGKQQVAQRKSGPDYEPSLTRSLFGSISAPANVPVALSQGFKSASLSQPQIGQRSSSSILGMLGLSSSEPQPTSGAQTSSVYSSGPSESKSQSSSGAYSGSIVNKVKSYFTRSSNAPSSQPSPPSPSDPYQRMSFMQALIKETNFLPGFLSSNRKLAPAAIQPASGIATSAAKPASSSSAAAPTVSQQPGPAARMQVDSQPTMQATSNTKGKPAAGGYGLVKAADRIAHALLETFTYGVAQRGASTSGSNSALDGQQQKSSLLDDPSQQNQQSSLSSATSFLNDIMSSYNAASSEQQQPQSSSASQTQVDKTQAQSSSQQEAQATGRATDASALIVADESHQQQVQQQYHSNEQQQQQHQQAQLQPKSNESQKPQVINLSNQPAVAHPSSESPVGKVRKTRSIGLEYPIENNQELVQRHPSRATQINNVIDYVSDSYAQNRLLINLIMNQVGLSQAVPYMEQILGPAGGNHKN